MCDLLVVAKDGCVFGLTSGSFLYDNPGSEVHHDDYGIG
jgi:hypothetical protein